MSEEDDKKKKISNFTVEDHYVQRPDRNHNVLKWSIVRHVIGFLVEVPVFERNVSVYGVAQKKCIALSMACLEVVCSRDTISNS